MTVPFSKMHGLGNDFMVLDYISNDIEFDLSHVSQLSHRQFGIGFDQLLMILPPSTPEVDFDYRIYNADGAEVEHCGNGARCFAKYVHCRGLTSKNPITVNTVNRTLRLTRNAAGDISVDMACPSFDMAELPLLSEKFEHLADHQYAASIMNSSGENQVLKFSALSLGNPHAVTLVDDVDKADVAGQGKLLGSHPGFPKGVNVGFMQILDTHSIRLRVFERGSGETLACGTGACAAVVAGIVNQQLESPVHVKVLGGELDISWNGEPDASVVMTGSADFVYDGILN